MICIEFREIGGYGATGNQVVAMTEFVKLVTDWNRTENDGRYQVFLTPREVHYTTEADWNRLVKELKARDTTYPKPADDTIELPEENTP